MAPDGLKSGRIVFASGLTGIRLLAGDSLPGPVSCCSLHRYDWPLDEHGMAKVVCGANEEGRLSLACCPSPVVGKGGEVLINRSILWEIEVDGDAAHLDARLANLTLRSLDVLGNASQISLDLPVPPGTAYLYIAGDARDIGILRPHGVGIALTLPAGSTQMQFDGRHYPRLAYGTRLESAGFERAASRYEVAIGGIATRVSISGGKK